MSELETYIRSCFGISPADMQTVAGFFQSQTLEKGDFFLKTGRHSDRLSFVQSGLLRVFVDLQQKEITQWIATPGYFVTDLGSFLFQTPARWNIQALTDCRLYSIHVQDYRRLPEQVPRWHELEKMFIARCFVILEDRMFRQISMGAEERYDALFAQQPDLFNEVPLQHLASMLGMTAETLSRIRGKKRS